MPYPPSLARLKPALTALVLFTIFALPARAFAVILARFEENGLRITLSDDSTGGSKLFRVDIEDLQKTSEFDLAADVFVLERPVRLVIDVPGFAAKRSLNKTIPHAEIGAMRLGRHPDKARIVIDFKGGQLPNHHLRLAPNGKKLTIDIGYFGEPVKARNSEDAESTAAGATPSTSPENTYEESAGAQSNWEEEIPPVTTTSSVTTTLATTTSTTERTTTSTTAKTTLPKTTTTLPPAPEPAEPLDLPISKEQLNKMIQEDAQEPALPEPLPPSSQEEFGSEFSQSAPTEALPPAPPLDEPPVLPPAPTGNKALSGVGSTVSGIFFKADSGLAPAESTAMEGSKGSPAIMVSVEPLGNYSLTQEKPNVYQLVIEQSHLGGEHLALPQFPPDALSGFEVVSATQEGDDVVVKIYVEDNIKLSPFRVNNQVWLNASQ